MSRRRILANPGPPTTFDEATAPVDPQASLVSKITFLDKGNPFIHYADVAVPDPLNACPIQDATPDLVETIRNLVTSTSEAIKATKDSTTDHCTALQTRMKAIQTDVTTAVTNQFVAAAGIASKQEQVEINFATQKASAINQLFQVTSDLFQNNCIVAIDKRVLIQKIIGQIITFSGIFTGGWSGIATASAGQLIASLPLFHNNIDLAIQALQAFEEKKNRISFLCLYRQVAKAGCMLFATPKNRFINGFDMTFETGAPKKTVDSIHQLESTESKLLADTKLLRRLIELSTSLIPKLTLASFKEGSTTAFNEMTNWCLEVLNNSEVPLSFQSDPGTHPAKIVETLNFLQDSCTHYAHFEYPDEIATGFAATLGKFYISLDIIQKYYQQIKREKNSTKNYVAETWESLQFFTALKTSMEHYQNTDLGNQARTDYFRLTEELANTIGKDSFRKIMNDNYELLSQSYPFSRRFRKKEPVHNLEVRSNALIAMLKACQTLDPTLTCLYVDPPVSNILQKEWVRQCVGPNAPLCSLTLKRKEKEKLLRDHSQFITYFDSLCSLGPHSSKESIHQFNPFKEVDFP